MTRLGQSLANPTTRSPPIIKTAVTVRNAGTNAVCVLIGVSWRSGRVLDYQGVRVLWRGSYPPKHYLPFHLGASEQLFANLRMNLWFHLNIVKIDRAYFFSHPSSSPMICSTSKGQLSHRIGQSSGGDEISFSPSPARPSPFALVLPLLGLAGFFAPPAVAVAVPSALLLLPRLLVLWLLWWWWCFPCIASWRLAGRESGRRVRYVARFTSIRIQPCAREGCL